jgi:malate dehydrogenase
MRNKVSVAVTGAAGNIGYAMLPRLASGEVFGPNTEIELRLLEITPVLPALEGVVMEMMDCAFPLLTNMVVTDDPNVAFDGVNWALLVGARPRSAGMERGDLIMANGPIFTGQGKALNNAADDCQVLVVGNPANTNALIAMHNNSKLPKSRFHALTRLDQNRAQAQLAMKAGVALKDVTNVTIWGNHSATQYPDAESALINGKPVFDVIGDRKWLRGEFISTVQKRGAAIIKARGQSSAMSAANAALDHVMSFEAVTAEGDWFSAAVPSDGSYGITKGLIFSFPVSSKGGGDYEIVQGLSWTEFAAEKVAATEAELIDERNTVADLLG